VLRYDVCVCIVLYVLIIDLQNKHRTPFSCGVIAFLEKIDLCVCVCVVWDVNECVFRSVVCDTGHACWL